MKTKYLLLCLLYSIIVNGQINLSSGLKAKFDFNGNALDLSGNGNNGVINGAQLTFDRFGNPNSAFSFDGINQNIVVPNFGSVIPYNDITISVWVKTDHVKTQGIFTLYPDNNNDRLFAGVYYSHNGVSSTFWDFGDLQGTGRLGEVGTFFQQGWEHYVFISSATQNMMQVYRNGYLKLMKTGFSSIINRNRDFCIAGNYAGTGNATNCYFSGVIDDIRIYDRALNPSEVVSLYRGYESSNVKDLRVFITNHPNPRPGFNEHLYVNYQNVGTSTLNGYVELFYDSNYVLNQSTPSQDSTNTNYLGWNLYNLPPGGQGYFDVDLTLPPNTSLGTNLSSHATIYPVIGDTTDIDNYDTLNQVVVGSYDPNYIEVIPSGDVTTSFISNQTYLYYIIHFQNTGTASAINVRTENQIDTNLFVSSVELMYSSHPYTYSLSNSNLLTINFDNINLPDSGSNLALSNGYVVYRVKHKKSLVVGDSIANVAKIYFDFNAPVTTNTVITKVVNNTSFEEFVNSKGPIFIYPNPLKENILNIKLDSFQNELITIKLFDVNEKLVLTKRLKFDSSNDFFEIPLPDLNSGLYTISIFGSRKVVNAKFIKL